MLRDRWGRRFRPMPHTFPVGDVLHLLWGGQSCPQPPFRRLFRDVSEPSRGKGRLKAAQRAPRSQDWLPHNLGTLIADQNVVAAFDHVSGAAAVLVPVAQAVRFQVVDEDGGASLGGDPGVGPAALGVNAGIGDAQRGPAVHIHVGRPGFGGSDAFVRTTRPVVRVLGYQGAIAEPGLFCHSTLSNISRGDRGQMPWR